MRENNPTPKGASTARRARAAAPSPSTVPAVRTVADNLRRVISASGMSQELWSAARSLHPRQVTRILQCEVSISLTYLSELADRCGLEPYQLLVPKLNITDPQTVSAGGVRGTDAPRGAGRHSEADPPEQLPPKRAGRAPPPH